MCGDCLQGSWGWNGIIQEKLWAISLDWGVYHVVGAAATQGQELGWKALRTVSLWGSGIELVLAPAKSRRYDQVEPATQGPGNDENCPDQLCWLQVTLLDLTAPGGYAD